SATSLTLAYPWPGATQTAVNYEVRFTPDMTRALASARELLEELSNGNLSALAALETMANKLPWFDGAGSAQLADLTSQARGLLGGSALSRAGSDYTLNGKLLGTAVTQNDKDTTGGRLHRTDDNILFHALRRFGGYYPAGGGANIDTAVAGDAGLYHDGNAGTFPGGASGNFWWITTQALYVGAAVMQRAILYAGAGTPPNTRNEQMRIRANDGTWGAWHTVYNAGSLLGTVSQSGGVPTGRVIERGSNANGYYVRFADGTQICWGAVTSTDTQSMASGALYRTAGVAWTFPAAFAVAPMVMPGHTGDTTAWFTFDAPSIASVFMRRIGTLSGGANVTYRATAIGYWF
ncbi:MAG: hypothetical protein BGP11_12910, partial [Rhodobacterales bacterium 65-51]